MTCALHLAGDVRSARSELLTACEDLVDTDLRRRPTNGGWAIIELLAHLPDVDRYYLSQAQAICDTPGHQFVYFDEEVWKRENTDAIERDAQSVKAAMASAHANVVRWTQTLTAEELARQGGHPRRESISVREMIQRIANHDHTHATQLRSIRHELCHR